MTHRRIPGRRAAVSAAAAALLTGTLAVAQANAAQGEEPDLSPATLSSAQAGQLATTLAAELPPRLAGGTYYDGDSGTLVVGITDESARALVEQSGARARLVEHSLAELEQVKDEIAEIAVPGTAWAVDPVANRVRVTVDGTVRGADLATIRQAVEELGDSAALEVTEGRFTPYLAGGDAIHSAGARCSLGFNVTVDGRPGFLTAGHCGQVGSTWSGTAGGEPVGTLVEGEFPGRDYALVEYTSDIEHPGEVNLYDGTAQEITGAAEAVVGQSVVRSGSTTGVHEGRVTAVDVSVEYPQGVVEGTIETTVCAEPGDSGGALFSGSDAIGLTSGGSGDCTSGGTTFFFPVTDALAAVGATIP